MNKQVFLSQLEAQLTGLPARQACETLDYYAEIIDDRMEDGMSEEEAVAALGSPHDIAQDILDELPVVPRTIAKTWRTSTVLLVILALLGSPLWIALGLAFLAVLATGYIVIWTVALVVWVFGVAFIAAGLAMFVIAWAGAFVGNIPFIFAFVGAGLCLIGIGALVCFVALMVSKLIAKLSLIWVKKMLSPFTKRSSRPGAQRPATPGNTGEHTVLSACN